MKRLINAVAPGPALTTTFAAARPVDPAVAASSPSAADSKPDVTWKAVPTQTISAGGVDFKVRELGKQNGGTPVVSLTHLAAVLDNWDPRVIDGIAARHHVIAFANRGIGASSGSPANSVEQMADDAITFIKALGLTQVDLQGFSLGGMVAQKIVRRSRSSSAR
jgi:pimeloyl-ACP methyl ester carboxylesterase